MKPVFRHYRQVKITRCNNQKPKVSSVEEVWYDGKGIVRYWQDDQPAKTEDYFGKPRSIANLRHKLNHELLPGPGWGPEAEPWFSLSTDMDEPMTVFGYPSEQAPQPSNEPSWEQTFPSLQQAWVKGTQKLQRMAQRLPRALQRAWQDITQE